MQIINREEIIRKTLLDEKGLEYEELTEIVEYDNGKVFRVITDTKGNREETEITNCVKK